MKEKQEIRRVRNNISILATGLLLMVVSFACQEHDGVYSKFYELENAEWVRENTFAFDVDSSAIELGVPYDITVELTNNVNYSYRNIYFFISHNLDNDSTLVRESKEYFLADEMGMWNGSGFGSLYQSALILKSKHVFRERRNYSFTVMQRMRDNPLLGIEKIGMRIIQSEK